MEQLVHTYGKSEASTIVNGGCSSRIFFPGLSLQTCEELERTLGRSTIRYMESGTHKLGEETDTARDMTAGRSLLMADEIRTMEDDQGLFIHGNKRPVMLKIKPYYKRRGLLRKSKMKPLERRYLKNSEESIQYLHL
jgi:type IV secretory pathway TraG/TraD family ATPase VirD4